MRRQTLVWMALVAVLAGTRPAGAQLAGMVTGPANPQARGHAQGESEGDATGQRPGWPGMGAKRMRPAEFAEFVDTYAVMQAQKMLALDEAQYGQFVPRFRALQTLRRRHAVARVRAIQELNRATRTDASDEVLSGKLAALEAGDARAATEVREAMAAVDAALTIAQRARFRVFEDVMERRTVDLLASARLRARRGGVRSEK